MLDPRLHEAVTVSQSVGRRTWGAPSKPATLMPPLTPHKTHYAQKGHNTVFGRQWKMGSMSQEKGITCPAPSRMAGPLPKVRTF